MFQKVIPLGEAGSLTIAESGGVAKLSASIGASLGGGAVAGVLKGSATLELDVGAQQLVDLGLDLAAAKFPSVAPLIAAAKSAIDAQLAKI